MLRGILFLLTLVLFCQCKSANSPAESSETHTSLEIIFPKGAKCIACQIVIHRVTSEFSFDSINVYTEEMRDIEKKSFGKQFKMETEDEVNFIYNDALFLEKKMSVPNFYKFGLVVRKSGRVISQLTGETYDLSELYKHLPSKPR